MRSRREFIQLASVSAMLLATKSWNAVAAKQQLKTEDLLDFDTKGQVTLLHLTDLHGQLKPVYFRPPSENFGVGRFEGIPPHLIGEAFLKHFDILPNTPLAYAHTMVDYVPLAMEYGKLGGLDHTTTLIKAIRSERGDDKVLLLDGGDTWQGSYTSLKTQGADMVEVMRALGTEAMVGHWEFTFGQDRLKELIDKLGYPFLGGNVFDTEWDEPVFESTAFFEKGGVSIAVIGQHFPYTPIANPSYMVEGWSFGIRPEVLQKNVNKAKKQGAEIVVLLSHNGFDVDQKLAAMINGIDVILTGHTHDAIPKGIRIKDTLLLSSGSHGKYLGRIDLKVKNGKVVDTSSNLIPVFSDIIPPDPDMRKLINKIRIFFKGLAEGVLSFKSMNNKGAFVLHTIFIWVMYVAMFYVIKWTVPETESLGIVALLPAFVIGGLTISATNGGVGIYPFSVALMLSAFGISNESGLAFGWIVWTSQTLMIIVFGSLSFFVLPLVNRKINF